MKKIKILILNVFLALFVVVPLQAQDMSNDFRSFFDQQFSYATRILDLAKATPADKFSWRPEEGVRSVGEVYIHIAQANYFVLSSLGINPPEGVNPQNMGSITGKDEVVAAFEESVDYVKSSVRDLPDSKLSETVDLFGRTITGQGALIFILQHTSEHGGQSIAYARTNGITPPWSEGGGM